jgi:hypothetical protein
MELFVSTDTYSEIDLVGLCKAMNKYSWAYKHSCWETDGKEITFQNLDQSSGGECIFKPMPTKPLIWYSKTPNGLEKTFDQYLPCGMISSESQLSFDPYECINVPIDILAEEFGAYIKRGEIKINMFSDLDEETCSRTEMRLTAEGSMLRLTYEFLPFSVEYLLEEFGDRIL